MLGTTKFGRDLHGFNVDRMDSQFDQSDDDDGLRCEYS